MAVTAVKERTREEDLGEITRRREERIQIMPGRMEIPDIRRNVDQVIDFWSHQLRSSYNMTQMCGDYMMKMWDTLVDQTMSLQQEQRNMQQQWMSMYRDMCQSMKQAGEENIEMMLSAMKNMREE